MNNTQEKTPEQLAMDACIAELNEVLQKHSMRLQPTFQLVPVTPQVAEDEVVDSAEEETEETE